MLLQVKYRVLFECIVLSEYALNWGVGDLITWWFLVLENVEGFQLAVYPALVLEGLVVASLVVVSLEE